MLEASEGSRALELFREHEIDLIILDIMLPELDGWSVCRRINIGPRGDVYKDL